MTSPVDTSVKFFHSKMPGAPVLRGQAGSLIAILDACLVNGWGIQTAASCVVAGGVCTMTFPLDHAAVVDAVVLVEGASVAALNGEQKVTATAPNVIKFATAAANGTATGTITAKMAPGGWNKHFSGTNLAVYKSASVQANGHFVRVNDTNALYARANAYENMTAVSTGTGIAPTAVQLSGGQYWHKSASASAAPIDWYCVSDGRMFYFGDASYQGNDPLGNESLYKGAISGPLFGFGDLVPHSPGGDPFSTMILGAGSAANSYSGGTAFLPSYGPHSYPYMMRAISGTGTAVPADCRNTSGSLSVEPVVDSVSGQIRMSKVFASTANTLARRAWVPGVYMGDAIYMEKALTHLSSFKAGTPERSYLVTFLAPGVGSYTGFTLLAFDLTGPWR